MAPGCARPAGDRPHLRLLLARDRHPGAGAERHRPRRAYAQAAATYGEAFTALAWARRIGGKTPRSGCWSSSAPGATARSARCRQRCSARPRSPPRSSSLRSVSSPTCSARSWPSTRPRGPRRVRRPDPAGGRPLRDHGPIVAVGPTGEDGVASGARSPAWWAPRVLRAEAVATRPAARRRAGPGLAVPFTRPLVAWPHVEHGQRPAVGCWGRRSRWSCRSAPSPWPATRSATPRSRSSVGDQLRGHAHARAERLVLLRERKGRTERVELIGEPDGDVQLQRGRR